MNEPGKTFVHQVEATVTPPGAVSEGSGTVRACARCKEAFISRGDQKFCMRSACVQNRKTMHRQPGVRQAKEGL